MSFRARWLLLAGLFASLVAAAPEAQAQPIDEATRSSARGLGEEAGELFEKGDYKGALDKYERADALVHLPTLRLREARCLDKLGRLVEASERYLAVTRMELPADALAVHREALVDAEKELAALRGRIPSLVIEVAGESDAEVTVDGAKVPAALYGQKRAINPGKHRVELRRGAASASRDVDVHEGETVPVKLELPKTEALPPAGAATPPPAVEPRSTGRLVVGGTLLGLGGAGIVVGAITGGMVLSKKSGLESSCGAELQCTAAHWDDADSYNRLRLVSSVTLIGGGVLAAGGALLLLTAPGAGSARSTAFLPWIGVGSAGLRGTFE